MRNLFRIKTIISLLEGLALIASLIFFPLTARAGHLKIAKDTLSNSVPGAAAVHTFNFTTRSQTSGGSFNISLPVAINSNDAAADIGGFDFNSLNNSDISVTGFTPSTININPTGGSIAINFSAPLLADTAVTIVIGSTNKILNPLKTASLGNADIWPIMLEEKDNLGFVVDDIKIEIGTIEAIVVSAKINPLLVFYISGVEAGTNVAGVNTDAATTPSDLTFGKLTPDSPKTLAQFLHLETNANSGYGISVFYDGPMRATSGAQIPDFNPSFNDNPNSYGFGFSMQNKIGSDSAFQYNDSGRVFNSRGFAQTPILIMSNSGPTAASESYIIYRAKISPTQPAANYQASVTFVATATF